MDIVLNNSTAIADAYSGILVYTALLFCGTRKATWPLGVLAGISVRLLPLFLPELFASLLGLIIFQLLCLVAACLCCGRTLVDGVARYVFLSVVCHAAMGAIQVFESVMQIQYSDIFTATTSDSLPLYIFNLVLLSICIVFVVRTLRSHTIPASWSPAWVRGVAVVWIAFLSVGETILAHTGTEYLLRVIVIMIVMPLAAGLVLYRWKQLEKAARLKRFELQQQYMDAVMNNWQSTQDLVENLLQKAASLPSERAGIQALYDEVHSMQMVRYSAHPALNAILGRKNEQAKGAGLTLKSEVTNVPKELPGIADIDLVTVMANLLDNAIEAAPQESQIVVNAVTNKTSLTLQVTNSVVPGHRFTLKWRSTKSESGHGLGLGNVRDALRPYKGSKLRMYRHKDRVVAVVVIPCALGLDHNKANT